MDRARRSPPARQHVAPATGRADGRDGSWGEAVDQTRRLPHHQAGLSSLRPARGRRRRARLGDGAGARANEPRRRGSPRDDRVPRRGTREPEDGDVEAPCGGAPERSTARHHRDRARSAVAASRGCAAPRGRARRPPAGRDGARRDARRLLRAFRERAAGLAGGGRSQAPSVRGLRRRPPRRAGRLAPVAGPGVRRGRLRVAAAVVGMAGPRDGHLARSRAAVSGEGDRRDRGSVAGFPARVPR